MPRRTTVTRGLTGLICLFILLTSCASPGLLPEQNRGAQQPTPTPTSILTPTPAPILPVPSSFQQSPAVEPQVQSGVLPPVNMRLPLTPKVVRPVEQVGRYGGTWHMVIRPYADQAQLVRTVAYEPLVRWTSDWSGIEPNLVESYTVNERATEYTFKLRRWTRWSDGLQFTTQDIRFWYNDILLNKELTPVIPSWLLSRGEVARFEFVDDITFKVHFSYPNSLFLEQLASPDALMITAFPAHYALNFHANHADPEALDQQIKDGGYASWAEMFVQRVGVNVLDSGNFIDPDRPRLSAWILVDPYVTGAQAVTWERNPYYWKVDPEGRQLPYIDSVRFDVVHSVDEAVNQVVNGKIDMQSISTLGLDSAVLFAGDRNELYDFYTVKDGSNNEMVINLNLAHLDLVKREIFRSKEFRIGMSYAIDRQEILEMIYQGQGRPWQAAPREDSPFYDPVMATQYTEHDQRKANDYLDRAGLDTDPLGNRLDADGMPISFSILVLENEPQQIAMLNLIARQLAEVGIDVQVQVESLPVFLATVQSNLHDAVAWRSGGTYFADVLLSPSSYLPSNEEAFWAITWAGWYNHIPGFEDANPELAARTSMDMYDRVRAAITINEQMRLMKGALLLARESFWTIGIALGPEKNGIMKKNFHNVPDEIPSGWIYPDPGPANPEQFYFSQ